MEKKQSPKEQNEQLEKAPKQELADDQVDAVAGGILEFYLPDPPAKGN